MKIIISLSADEERLEHPPRFISRLGVNLNDRDETELGDNEQEDEQLAREEEFGDP
jgi:hypothetical protein